MSVFNSNGILVVVGDAAADSVALVDTGNGNVVVVANGQAQFQTGVQQVAIATDGGNDQISYTVVGNVAGGAAGDAFFVNIDAGDGDDTIVFNGAVLDRSLTFVATGGEGNDALTSALGGTRLGATTLVALNGAGGDDQISAFGSGQTLGTATTFLEGGFGNDRILGAGNVTSQSTGLFQFVANGDEGDDLLDLNLSGEGAAGVNLGAAIDGGIGFDTGTSTSNVAQGNFEA